MGVLGYIWILLALIIISYALIRYTTSSLLNSTYQEYLQERDANPDVEAAATIQNAIDTIPCYSKIVQDGDIPIMTKQQLRESTCVSTAITPLEYTRAITTNSWSDKTQNTASFFTMTIALLQFFLDNRNALAVTTGGTSGNSFYYWYNLRELKEFAKSYFYCWETFGWDPSKRVLVYYGHPSGGLQIIKYFTACNVRALVPAFENGDITDASICEFLAVIEYQRPHVVESMPNVIFRVAQYMYRKGLTLKHRLSGLSLSGDFLFRCQYDFIRKVFDGVPVRMSYGTVEFGQIAQQASDDDLYTYRVFRSCAYVETINGTLAVTRYRYRNMPIIRYHLDDHGIVSDDGEFIYDLIGKNQNQINPLIVNRAIERCALPQIINVRIGTDRLYVVVIDELTPMDIRRIELATGMPVTIESCTTEICPTRDNLEKKVSPFSF